MLIQFVMENDVLPINGIEAQCNNDNTNNINNNNNNSNNNNKTKKEKKKLSIMLKNCCFRCSNGIKRNFINFYRSMKIRTQLLIFFIFGFCVICLVSVIIHILCYRNIFAYDFYTGEKEKFIDQTLNKLTEQLIKLSNYEITSKFQDKVSNQLFFKIYLTELIQHNLLSGESISNISDYSESFYNDLNNASINYTIPKESAKTFIDTPEQNNPVYINQIKKIFWYFVPLILQENEIMNNRINSAYLIAYQYNNSTKMVTSDMRNIYFNYPIETLDNFNYENFYNNNPKIDPNITLTNVANPSENGNWFEKIDMIFRNNHSSLSQMSFINLSLFRKENIISNIIQVNQMKFEDFNLSINIFFKYDREAQLTNGIDYSVFAISNISNSLVEDKSFRFYDNTTYVISQNAIASISIGEELNNFFSFGMKEKNSLFYTNGKNFDIFNVDFLANPEDNYIIQTFFTENVRVFSSLYFYTKFMQKENYATLVSSLNETKFDNTFLLTTKSNTTIKEICDSFNFFKYREDIEKYSAISSFSCFSDDQLYYYQYNKEKRSEKHNSSFFEYPKCQCIPFYCIGNIKKFKNMKNTTDIKLDYSSDITLPTKCSFSLESYYTPQEGEKGRYLYEQHYKYLYYTWVPLDYTPEFSLLISLEVDKGNNKKILKNFKTDVYKKIETTCIIHGALFFAVVVGIIILLAVRLTRFTNIINQYMEKHQAFLFNIEGRDKNIGSEEKDDENKGGQDDTQNDSDSLLNDNMQKIPFDNENSELLDLNKKKKKEHIYNDNILIDDLFNIYCNYYNYDPDKILLQNENKNLKTKNSKLEMMKRQNDLFDILCSLSQNAPKFKFNLTLDYNLYFSSKLNMKYLKGLSNFSNVDKKQLILTQSILFELLSTENVSDYGLVLNMRFNYVDNIKFNQNDCIKKVLFQNYPPSNFKLIGKKKDELCEFFEKNAETDDVFGAGVFESSFNFFLINVYYKYYGQILQENEYYSSKYK